MTYTTTRPSGKRKASGLWPLPMEFTIRNGPVSLSETVWNTVELLQNMCPRGEFSGHPHTYRWYLPSAVWRMLPPQNEMSGCSMPLSTYRFCTLSVPQMPWAVLPCGMGRKRSIKRAPLMSCVHSAGRSRSVIWAWRDTPIVQANKKKAIFFMLFII